MAKSNNAFIKKLKAQKKKKKKLDKIEKKKNREKTGGSLEEMIAYVDEFGNITSESPEEREEKQKEKEKKERERRERETKEPVSAPAGVRRQPQHQSQ